MIYADFRNNNGLKMRGTIEDVSAECVLIMRQLYLKNSKQYGQEISKSILMNMLNKAIEKKQEKDENQGAAEAISAE